MNFRQSILFVLGIALILAAPLWSSKISQVYTKLPANYGFDLDMDHSENNRFNFDEDWSGSVVSLSNIKNFTEKTTESESLINSSFIAKSITGATLFDLEQKYLVDRYNNHDLPGYVDATGSAYYMFPHHTQKISYQFWPGTFGKSFKMNYIDTTTIDGLKIYHFRGQDNAIDDTLGYSFLPLVPEKYRALSKATVDVFIEPVSGIIINYYDKGVSYYSDSEGHRLWDISQWSNELKESSIHQMAATASKARQTILLHEYMIPFGLLSLGIFLLYKSLPGRDKK